MTNMSMRSFRSRHWLWFAFVPFLACTSERREEPIAPIGNASAVHGKAPPATGLFPSIVLLEPGAPIETLVPEEPAVMDQYGTAFHPKVLLVRPGQPVDFKNSEDVLHNVHVVHIESRETEFNVGTPVVGSYRHRFEREGAYDVSCEIHPSMAALLFVTSAPFATIADSQGNFEISSVPAGSYRLTVWNLDPNRRFEQTVEVGEGLTQLTIATR
jgi:plastocyanin